VATRWRKSFEDMFVRFHIIHLRDRHPDGRTLHYGIGRACIASRGKNRSKKATSDTRIGHEK